MASHYKDNVVYGRNHPDVHASDSKWRHQESAAFAKHAALTSAPKAVREADAHSGVSDLSEFFNKSRVDVADEDIAAGPHKPIAVVDSTERPVSYEPDAADKGAGAQNAAGVSHNGPDQGTDSGSSNPRELRCGPLLNYRRMEGTTWFGSVLIVTRGGSHNSSFKPELIMRRANSRKLANGDSSSNGNGMDSGLGPKATNVGDGSNFANGRLHESSISPVMRVNGGARVRRTLDPKMEGGQETKVEGVMLYGDPRNVFWRFQLQLEMEETETHWEYAIPGLAFQSGMQKTDEQSFFVPARNRSMRIMFHSCNGFSVGTDEEAWSGPALWNDVLRVHRETPFHVMIGGGDQIYNDGIRINGPLRQWTDIPNPKKRKDYKFPESLRRDCDDYYVANYIRWYATEPFASANGQIPQLNLWDDHDIIDGFGSYVSEFMKCDVFRGIGGTAYKYYMLFQHHLPPPISTYTTDAPQTMQPGADGVGADPTQMKDCYVLQNEQEDPSYIIGDRPGPYVAERSRSIYARLGARIAFFGIDARTERTRHQVNYTETYDKVFTRLKEELKAAASSPNPIQHLIVLLGIPIAYPRLTWLENILRSPMIGPIKFLNRRFGVAGGVFNKFDGSVDLLDDLDDHYTAKTHKKERHDLVCRLQSLASSFSVRVTILGGDVHLAACGRFYSNPKLGVPAIADHRYMANIISSAIVNKPPPPAIANLLARRNKIHHLDENTDETLLDLFDRDPEKDRRTAESNHTTMPSRNWAMITENPSTDSTTNGVPSQPRANKEGTGASTKNGSPHIQRRGLSVPVSLDHCTGRDGHFPLHPGEVSAGTQSRAVTHHASSGDGSLDVCIRVEKNQKNKQGHTQAYGFWIPPLKYDGAADVTMRKRDAIPGAVNARA